MRENDTDYPGEILIPFIDKKVTRIENMRTGDAVDFETRDNNYAIKQDSNGDLNADVYVLHYI
jgi:acetamidase/formamidase